jgi:hypothetical protein
MKIEALIKNSRVCFEMDIDQELVRSGDSCSMRYRSVIGFGKSSFIEDAAGKRMALEALMRHYNEEPLEWPQEALDKVAVIKVEIESLTGSRREFQIAIWNSMKAGDSALLQDDDGHISPRTWLCDTPIIDCNFHRILRDLPI